MISKQKNNFSVLIVDDEKNVCEMIEAFLVMTGLFSSIVISNDINDAIRKLSNQEFDLLVVDNMLPGEQEGLDLIERILSYKSKKYPKFILISAGLRTKHVTRAIQLGIRNILTKPFGKSSFIEKVQDALKL